MAINLLGNANLASGIRLAPLAKGGNVMSTNVGSAPTPPTQAPIGVKAKAPATGVSGPSTTLPVAQKSPVQPLASAPVKASDDSSYKYNTMTGQLNTNYSGYTPPATTPPEAPKQPVQPTYIPNTNPSANASFGGYLGQLVNQQNSPYNSSAMQSISALQSGAQKNPGTSGQAYTDYQSKVNDLNSLKQREAQQLGGTASQPIPLEFQQGRAQVLQHQYAQQNTAAQEAVDQAQQAVQNQIQGAQYQQTGYNNAASQALAGQGQQQSALSSAAGYAQPQVTGYGQTSVDPLNNQFGAGGGGNLDPQTQASTLAKQVQSGQITYDQAVQSMGYAGSAGTTFLNNAITSAGGNPLTLQAQGTAQQNNLTTAGTTPTNTAASGYSDASQKYTQMQGINTSAEGQIQQVQNVLTQTGLNQGVPDYNKALNSLTGRLGSTGVTQLTTAVTELQNIYSQLLNTGGTTPSGSEAQALQLLNPSSSAAQINAAIQQLQVAAYNRLNGQYQQVQTYSSGLGGTPIQQGSQAGSSAPVSAGGFNFHKDAQGNWVAS